MTSESNALLCFVGFVIVVAACYGSGVGEHLIGGEFQSDKYPWCKRGFVPLKLTDPMAQPLLWEYAQARRSIDPEFANDLEKALRIQGYRVRPLLA